MLPIIASIVVPVFMSGLVTAVSVATADADAAGAPVKIERCTVSEQAVMQNPKIGLRLPQVSGVTIVYTNERAATEIRFRIRYQGVTNSVIDRGSFAPGQKISRDFSNVNAIFSSPSADCSVTSVTFVDGTRWNASDAADTAPK